MFIKGCVMQTNFAGLKICLIGPTPPPAGGMGNLTVQLQAALTTEGAAVDLVQVNAPYSPKFVAKVPGIRAVFRLVPYLIRLYRSIGQSDVCHLMANSGWSWHLFAAPAIWIAAFRRKPMVMNYHGGHAEAFFSKSWSTVGPSVRKCNVVIVPSPYLQRIFNKFNVATTVVPNALDHHKFYAKEPQRTLPSNKTFPFKLIVTRNLESIYDIATAIKGFALLKQQYPNITLEIAGSGPEEAALKSLCTELVVTEAVTFLGRLNSDQMSQLYRSADLVLNPSRVDNSPISIVEALASGTPVISTDVGGIPDLVIDGVEAILIPAGEPEIFCHHASVLLSDIDCRQQLINNGLAKAANFAWPAVKTVLLQSYQAAIVQSKQQAFAK
jgi:glycosyltransferase involved in cell wall biosynthesis